MSMKFLPTVLSVLLVLGGFMTGSTQEDGTIFLVNPSFEDMPSNSRAPIGWSDCGFPGESAPDVQPDPMGTFQVSKPAYHGSTYLGMVVRDNDTWERVSQKLSKPMQAGQCYEFKLHLARSEMYVSQTRTTNREQNYVTPAVLRIYGGNNVCDRGAMLAESEVVINYRWIEYRFKLQPQENFSHIVFEAFYNTPTLFPYNGNVLLDNASPLVPISCDDQGPLVFDTRPKPPVDQTNTKPKPPTTTTRAPTPAPASEEPEAYLAGIPYSQLSEGEYIQLRGIKFGANSYQFSEESEEALDELYRFMERHPDVILEIGGHTNNFVGDVYGEELSTNRALSVANYLTKRGIPSTRIQAKGYGKSRQLDTKNTKEAQRINQRVEVKVLKKG